MLTKIWVLILKRPIHQNIVLKDLNFFGNFFCILTYIFFIFQNMLLVKVLQYKFVSTYTLSFQRPTLNILRLWSSHTLKPIAPRGESVGV